MRIIALLLAMAAFCSAQKMKIWNKSGPHYEIDLAFVDSVTFIDTLTVNYFLDERDSSTYRKIQIGTQVWMAQNLNYGQIITGTTLPTTTDTVVQKWCYNDSPDSCKIYGALYSWNEATQGKTSNSAPSGIRGICPKGWHLPSDSEFKVLERYVGMLESEINLGNTYRGTIAPKLKSKLYWAKPGFNDFGFNSFPSGLRVYSTGAFILNGSQGNYWTSSEYDTYNAWHRSLDSSTTGINRWGHNKNWGFSVRCIQD